MFCMKYTSYWWAYLILGKYVTNFHFFLMILTETILCDKDGFWRAVIKAFHTSFFVLTWNNKHKKVMSSVSLKLRPGRWNDLLKIVFKDSPESAFILVHVVFHCIPHFTLWSHEGHPLWPVCFLLVPPPAPNHY